MTDDPWCHAHNQPATVERYTDVIAHAVDADGYCWMIEFACTECLGVAS